MSQADQQRPHSRSWTGKIIFLLLAAGGGYWGYSSWHANKERAALAQQQANAPKPVSVTVAKAVSGNFDVRLEGLGTVQPINTVAIHTRVDGEVEKIFFKEGQFVKQGDLLARLDQRPFQAALEQANAKLVQDQATLKNAKLDLDRYSALAKQAFASRQQLDTQQATVGSTTAIVQGDQAAIDNAQTQLSYTEIRAPISGRVGFRQVDAGNIVHASDQQAMLSIVQMDPINVLYTLPEGDLASVTEALRRGAVPVTATVVGERVVPTVTGTVSVLNNQVDMASGTFQTKGVFDNANLSLWPGQSVTTKTLVQTLKNVVLVPVDAVQHGPNGLFIWKVDDKNIATAVKVAVKEQDSAQAVIASGLAAGDRFVTIGQFRLFPGVAVDPHEAKPGEQQAELTARPAQ